MGMGRSASAHFKCWRVSGTIQRLEGYGGLTICFGFGCHNQPRAPLLPTTNHSVSLYDYSPDGDQVDDTSKKEMLLREISLIKMLDHPNVIKVYEVFQTITMLYIVMELCTGGELFDKLYDQPGDKFSEADAHFLVKKMIGSLAYLHANKVVHRDLKLENFIFTDTTKDAEIKLIDFGFSRRYKTTDVMSNPIGTCYYMAPEVINQSYTEAADLWSVGVVIFMMLTGSVPFGGDGNAEIIQTIRSVTQNQDKMDKGLRAIMKGASLTSDCCDFVMTLLTVDIKARATAADALAHAWVTNPVPEGRGRRQTMGVDDTTAEEKAENSQNLMKNIKNFRNQSKLKRSALMAVSFNLTSAELKTLAAQFAEMDSNSDGIITRKEFLNMMTKNNMKSDEIDAAFDAIDQDGTGLINYSEFISCALDEKAYDEDHEVEEAFRRLDLDDSGEITVEDLKLLLPDSLSSDAVQRILDSADLSKDGKISLEEFKQVMNGGAV
jgi:calcium-dependent protein kinase